MVEAVIILVFFLGAICFGRCRALRYLRYYQQEEYSLRFIIWLFKARAFDTRALFVGCVTAGLIALTGRPYISLIGSVLLLILGATEPDPRKTGKVTLKMTERASRTFDLTLILFSLTLLALFWLAWISPFRWSLVWLALWVLVLLIPLFLLLANALLWPIEQFVQQGYLAQAKSLVTLSRPYVIGITGSYGKTSMKVALTELLNQCLGPTFTTPKSYNTLMGITREIRTRIRSYHKFAVIEMGAYGPGAITKLCQLTPPNSAIITCVGQAHLERFGSEQNIYRAKSELAKECEPGGNLVCNGDSPGARRMAKENPKNRVILYGLEGSDLDCSAYDLKFTEAGTTFNLVWRGKTFHAKTQMLGRMAVTNLLGAFALACELGANPEYAVSVLANIEPEENRLSMTKIGGVLYLKDAYNSNPDGFRDALNVLKGLKAERRILMTPGMIEYGQKQAEFNRIAATQAGSICDLVIVVGATNRAAFEQGLEQGGLAKNKIVLCETRTEAFATLKRELTFGAVVLIENDLTDLYEGTERF